MARASPRRSLDSCRPFQLMRQMPPMDTQKPRKKFSFSLSRPRLTSRASRAVNRGDTAPMTPMLEAVLKVRAKFSSR